MLLRDTPDNTKVKLVTSGFHDFPTPSARVNGASIEDNKQLATAHVVLVTAEWGNHLVEDGWNHSRGVVFEGGLYYVHELAIVIPVE